MSRLVRGTLCACLASLASIGCAHMIENRAIDRFAAQLRAENLDGLKTATSEEFSQRALRTATALEDIKILRLPDGKTTIVEVETTSDDHRRVTVQVGEEKKEVFYELVRDGAGKWVVDDVYLKQKKQGVTSFKSVTEQLDLLLTVREFLDGWDGGDRDQILKVTAPEFQTALSELPPSYLAQLTKSVLGKKSAKSSFKPQAQLDNDTAVVRLRRSSGETVVSLERLNDHWKVIDVAVDAKEADQQIASVFKQALAVNTCTRFLGAYSQEDKPQLATVCDKDFYEGSLGIANLKQIVLPDAEITGHDLEVSVTGQRANFLLKGENEIVQIDMRRIDASEPKKPPTFLVSDVTIYELESRQEKRLAALFTAQAMLELFTEALATRDLDHLRHSSTQDFSNRVWRRLNTMTIQGLPLEQFDVADFKVVQTHFQGSLTRIEVEQGGGPVTYFLREESGRFFVDDMQWQATGRPSSVKETLATLVPVQNFAAAIVLGRDPAQQKLVIEMLQETCSTDFNRMVWQQANFVPNSGLGADGFLSAPLKSIVKSEKDILIQLGDDRFGAVIRMRSEYNRELIDDVTLIAGPEPADRIVMKQTFRNLLASGEAIRPGQGKPYVALKPPVKRIQTAVYEEYADDQPHEVLHASDIISTSPGDDPRSVMPLGGNLPPRGTPPGVLRPDGAFPPAAPLPLHATGPVPPVAHAALPTEPSPQKKPAPAPTAVSPGK